MPSPRQLTQLLLLIVLAIAACKQNDAFVPTGDVTESLKGPSLGAIAFDPAGLKGKPTLVMFVTPSCPHCVATIPRGEAAAEKTGANVVAVFVSGDRSNVEGVISHLKFKGTALVPSRADQKELIAKYKITGVPYSVVLGPNGHAREAFRAEQQESTFKEALAAAK